MSHYRVIYKMRKDGSVVETTHGDDRREARRFAYGAARRKSAVFSAVLDGNKVVCAFKPIKTRPKGVKRVA